MKTLYHNMTLFSGTEFIENAKLCVEDGYITHAQDNAKSIDLEGLLLVPGFIDIQVNGGGGVMINDGPFADDIETTVAAHRQFGTTAMLPTLITDHQEKMTQMAELYEATFSLHPAVLGVHFEGPHLNEVRKGVHQSEYIRDFSQTTTLSCQKVIDNGGVCLITLAPERIEPDIIRGLNKAGCKIFAGHTAASYDEMVVAIEAGLCGVTHLHNAMSPLTSREPGVVGASLVSDIWSSLIVDGFHVHPATIQASLAARATFQKDILVTDAMGSVGAQNKDFNLYGTTITAQNGRCITSNGTLAGSDLSMIEAVRNVIKFANIPLDKALQMASLHPAQMLGRKDLGQLHVGARADMVLLNDQLDVVATWVEGQDLWH